MSSIDSLSLRIWGGAPTFSAGNDQGSRTIRRRSDVRRLASIDALHSAEGIESRDHSAVRRIDDLPLELIGEAIAEYSVGEFIEISERARS